MTKPIKYLEGEKIYLRYLELEDVGDFYYLVNSDSDARSSLGRNAHCQRGWHSVFFFRKKLRSFGILF